MPFGVAQASYRITVSSRSDGEHLLWDSGHVASNASSEIVYGGGQQAMVGAMAFGEALTWYQLLAGLIVVMAIALTPARANRNISTNLTLVKTKKDE